MIPKVIHYCWFGGNPLPELAQKCIASWRKYCPEYEIIEWNESNYDISSAPLFVRQAYDAQKWGFVPDYIRLDLVYRYGGIYLDTDVEIIKPIDDLLESNGFAGFESEKYIALGLGFGAEKGSPVIWSLMQSYVDRFFINEDGTYNMTPAPKVDADAFDELGFIRNGKYQDNEGFIIYPTDYFSPMDFKSGKIDLSENTYSIHHFMASWFSDEEKNIMINRRKYAKYMPLKIAHWLSLMVGFTKYRGFLRMPHAMIEFKKNNLKRIKEEQKHL